MNIALMIYYNNWCLQPTQHGQQKGTHQYRYYFKQHFRATACPQTVRFEYHCSQPRNINGTQPGKCLYIEPTRQWNTTNWNSHAPPWHSVSSARKILHSRMWNKIWRTLHHGSYSGTPVCIPKFSAICLAQNLYIDWNNSRINLLWIYRLLK